MIGGEAILLKELYKRAAGWNSYLGQDVYDGFWNKRSPEQRSEALAKYFADRDKARDMVGRVTDFIVAQPGDAIGKVPEPQLPAHDPLTSVIPGQNAIIKDGLEKFLGGMKQGKYNETGDMHRRMEKGGKYWTLVDLGPAPGREGSASGWCSSRCWSIGDSPPGSRNSACGVRTRTPRSSPRWRRG